MVATITIVITSILDYAVPLADALAWPLVVLTLALIFRKPLVNMISNIESIKFPWGEAKIGQQIEDVSTIANSITLLVEPPHVDERIPDVADFYPSGVIIESWLLVEKEMTELAESHQLRLTPQQRRLPNQITQALVEADIIDAGVGAAIRGLREIRNKAVHTTGVSLSMKDAQEYAQPQQGFCLRFESGVPNSQPESWESRLVK